MQTVVNSILTGYQIVNPNQKDVLLILHGWGQSSNYWQTVLNSLPSNITGIALDLPSFGSTQPLPKNPGVPEYTDFVKNFINKQKIKNFILLGHSFGGQIAVDFSLRFPKLLKHLILVSPASIRQTTPGKKSKIATAVKPLLKALSPHLYDRLFAKIASENYLNSTPVQRTVLNKILYQDYSDRLENISIPTSIIWGDKDVTIKNSSKLLAQMIPNSHLYILYGADHNPHFSVPQKFIPLLNKIIEKNAA